MSKRANPTVIGVFVLVAVALLVAGILTLGGLRLFSEETTAVAFFDGDVSGLAVGSPVLFRGAQIGQVSRIAISLDPHNKIAVYVKLEWKRRPEAPPPIRTQKEVQPFIDRGLRAQLRVVSFVTGQLSVSLDYLPNTPVVLTGLEPDMLELPTVPTQLAQFQARLERFLASLEQVDLAQVAQDVSEMVRSVRDLARSPALARALVAAGDAFRSADVTLKTVDSQVAAVGERAGATLDDARTLVKNVDREIASLAASLRNTLDTTHSLVSKADREIEPLAASLRNTLDTTHSLVSKADREIEPLAASLRNTLDTTHSLVSKADREIEPLVISLHSTLESARGALGTVSRALDGDTPLGDDLSQALRQLAGAARSLNALADYLQRHPEALLRGKQGAAAK